MQRGHVKEERKRQWREAVRRDVRDAVVDVLIRDGFSGLTMEKVAKRAQVAKGTLYLLFEDKQQLLDATVQAIVEPLTQEVAALLETELPPDAKLRRMAFLNLRFFDQHRAFFRIFLHERYQSQSHATRSQSNQYRLIRGKVIDAVAEGVETGVFRRLDSQLVATIWIEGIVATFVRRMVADEQLPLEQDLDALCDLFFCGLRLKP